MSAQQTTAPDATVLRDALRALLDHYVRLVESGDAGFWDAEAEPVVIQARAALSSAPPAVGTRYEDGEGPE